METLTSAEEFDNLFVQTFLMTYQVNIRNRYFQSYDTKRICRYVLRTVSSSFHIAYGVVTTTCSRGRYPETTEFHHSQETPAEAAGEIRDSSRPNGRERQSHRVDACRERASQVD